MINSLYVHIPFCDHICNYCDFCKVYYDKKTVDEYLDCLERELKQLNIQDDLKTIYIGGGTPSSLNDQQLEKLLTMLKPYSIKVDEYTIECNPESMDYYKLKTLKQFNVNRLSIGVQTFNDNILKGISRHHNKQQVLTIIKQAKEIGFENISIDLMYGLPNQTTVDIENDINTLKQLDIQHISYYALILEDHTVLKNNDYQPLNEEDDYKINLLIDSKLQEIGYKKYEISNYCKDGYASKHNKVYWQYDNYYGIGISATGKNDNELIEHSRSLTDYLLHKDVINETKYTKEDAMFNQVMMSLRLVEGLNIDKFYQKYHQDVLEVYKDAIEKNIKDNLEISDGFLKVKEDRLYLLNAILLDFMK